MDQKALNQNIAKTTGIELRECNALGICLAEIITHHLSELDTVAIPGFGTFTAVQSEEYIRTDDNGKRYLMPPSIKINFIPGTRLKKSTSPLQS